MRWDRFFEDIEDQLASEWEAERAALDTEAERLRLSRLALHDRLGALAAGDADADAVTVSLELAGGAVITAPIAGLGADWLLASPWGSRAGAAIVPLAAVTGVCLPHAELLRSARPQPAASGISRRASFGFAVRDIVRRRAAAAVHLRDGRALTGTIDRAGADHLDIALHEPGAVRRAGDVTGYRLVPFEAIAWIAVDGANARTF